MKRRAFVRSGCTLCMGVMAGVSVIALMDSCASGKILKKTATEDKLYVSKSEFEAEKSFVIVRTEDLNYDLLLNKVSETEYTAVLLQCTHYDNPVFANNKEIFCPSHGSKFDFSGKVLKEPAIQNLKQYKTQINNDQIIITLK